MKCRKCKTEIEKGLKFCPNCGAKIKRRAGRVIAIILALAIGLGGAGIAAWKLGFLPLRETSETGGFAVLNGDFTDRKITDQSSALAAIDDVAAELGIQDVDSELADCKEDTVSGNTYYRFYQEYEGIPVYGRSVVVAADENGESLLLSGNYLTSVGVDVSPAISEADALQAAAQNYEDGTEIVSDGLIIYSLGDHAPELAWKLYIDSDGIAEYCIISAVSGEILSHESLVYYEAVVGSGNDIDGRVLRFNTTEMNGWLTLEDESRNIHIYNANNETLIRNITADDEGVYSCELSTQPEGSARMPLLPVLNTFMAAKNWEDSKAVTAMTRAASLYDFYKEIFDREGFNGKNGKISLVYNDRLGGDTGNAYSSAGQTRQITVLSFGIDNSMSQDSFGHEFAHSVEQSISAMAYAGESGALMEAYSDIFGEIYEDWLNNSVQQENNSYTGNLSGNCDWVHDGIRDLKNPKNIKQQVCYYEYNGETCPVKEKTGKHTANGSLTVWEGITGVFDACQVMLPCYPDYYHGEAWADTTPQYNAENETTNDHGGVHTNCTVISHAAYLMNAGIDGSAAFESLSTEELAHLFYETLYSLPSDCTFSQFRTLLENTAEIMRRQGRLSNKQVRCVSRALSEVGIDSEGTGVCKEKLTVDVYGANGELYEDYTLYVRQSDGSEKKYHGKEVSGGISFPAIGKYELYIEDNADPTCHTSVQVNVLKQGGATKLPVSTKCGLSTAATPLLAYLAAGEKTTATGSWTENVDMNADLTLKRDSGTVKTKATMESSADIEGWNGADTSTLYMSGHANISIMNQSIAYTMTWKDGTAHYEYTEPEVSSADLQIDPSYFDFGALTERMLKSSSMRSNRISFVVKSEDLTKIGTSAVNSFFSGVGDLKYSDAAIETTIDKQSGKIDTMTMSFSATMTYQGYDVEAEYEIKYHFTDHTAASIAETPAETGRTLGELAEIINAYFADYNWGDDDILLAQVFEGEGYFQDDENAAFILRAQTKSAEWTQAANVGIGNVVINTKTLQGYVDWADSREYIDFLNDTPSGGDTPDLRNNDNARDMWLELLSSGEYKAYTAEWVKYFSLEDGYPTDYAILDIDGDGWEELLLRRRDDSYFAYYALLTCDQDTGEIQLAQAESDVWAEGGLSPVFQSCKGMMYSLDYKALVYTELNNGSSFGSYGYRSLVDGELICQFSVGFDRTSGTAVYDIWQNGAEQEISEAEYRTYLGTCEDVEFLPISELAA